FGSDWVAADAFSTHAFQRGTYHVHAYANRGGAMVFLGATTIDYAGLSATVALTTLDRSKGEFALTISNVAAEVFGLEMVVPTWSVDNNQSDLVWYDAALRSDGVYTVWGSISNHAFNTGDYVSDVYARLGNGQLVQVGHLMYQVQVDQNFLAVAGSGGTRTVYLINPSASASQYVFPTWSLTGGQDDLSWIKGSQKSANTWTATVDVSSFGSAGTFETDVYACDGGGSPYGDCLGRTTYEVAASEITSGYTIMGASSATAAMMVARYNQMGKPYPSAALSRGGAGSIEEFCTILYEEAVAEGVKSEVVFAQAMHETGWLQFGGDVSVEQFNFSGIGATGGGVPGNSFSSVREGLRAQVQHLKAYASTAALVNPVVDPRFTYVTRGCAPTVEDLGGRWAAGGGYGDALRYQISQLLALA
ncbi:MAG: GBS Bsp-like repeat-containing protein, partial [Coriobacteriia bacterium]|nr:GBS Bsp-like repeat-containing protein [Coriobacteriia bacterium]